MDGFQYFGAYAPLADVAQSVAHHLGKVEVAGPIPAISSKTEQRFIVAFYFCFAKIKVALPHSFGAGRSQTCVCSATSQINLIL